MKISTLLCSTIFLLSLNTSAQTNKLTEVFKLFKKGDYTQTIKLLKNTKKSSEKFYLLAISYNRLQEFDKSIRFFKLAIKMKSSSKDLYYEYGQALYAASELEESRQAFTKSYKLKHKPASSLYYMGHISQILEEYKTAKNYYQKVLKIKEKDINILQVSRFQLAETLLSLARKKKKTSRIVKKYILPQIQKAIDVSDKSKVAKDIIKRKAEIEKEFGLDPNLMVNGRRIPKKSYRLNFYQKLEYDNNITQSTDQPTVKATQKDSYIFETGANTNYRFIIKRRFTLKPGLKITKVKHNDRDTADVYTNDYWSLSPSLKSGLEHRLFNKVATTLFDITYDYKERDRESNKKKIFYNRSLTLTIGEKVKFFSFGNSTIKLKNKTYRSWDQALHNDVTTVSFDQVVSIPKKFLVLGLFQYDATDYFNDTTASTKSKLLRFDFIKSNFLQSIDLGLNVSSTFLTYDDEAESATNGTELTLASGFSLTKKVSKLIRFIISYDYTNASSDNSSNKYSKHVTGAKIKLNF